MSLVAAIGCVLTASGRAAFTAETMDPTPMTRTLVILKVDADEAVAVQSTFHESPSTITIQFPKRRLTASLPERSTLGEGVVRAITAEYGDAPAARQARFLNAVRLELAAPYAYGVRSEPGQIIVEIEHPAAVISEAVQIGLTGGTIIEGLQTHQLSERFRAMQEALARVRLPARVGDAGLSIAKARPALPSAQSPTASIGVVGGGPQLHMPAGTGAPLSTPPTGAHRGLHGLVLMALVLLGVFVVTGSHGFSLRVATRPRPPATSPVPAAVQLMDQLLWHAFEQDGYQLVAERDLAGPLTGRLRLARKGETTSAILFVSDSQLWEKQGVERFLQVMREAGASQGILLAPGVFTVPAQRLAKEHGVALIGREQLAELVSLGAGREHVAKQLELQQARLEEAKETLQHYAAELDTLRRQRNDASWSLGEERAKTAALEATIAQLTTQLEQHQAAVARWEQDLTAARKRWEENEWYLGEARERLRYLDGQLAAYQEIAKRVEVAEHERDEANWYLGEERSRSEVLERQLADLQRQLQASGERERVLQEALIQVRAEARALRAYGERRSAARLLIPGARFELSGGVEQAQPLAAGVPLNLSRGGMRFEMPGQLPELPSVCVRVMLPGQEPLQSRARIVWRAGDAGATRYGCRFINVPAATRSRLERLLAATQPPEDAAAPSG